ncbi:MAG: replication initiation protein [Mangrovicoccus sp.]
MAKTQTLAEIPKERLTGALRRESVKKHVAAIHVSGKLTLLQRKLSNVLLLNAYDMLTTAPMHRIDASTLCLMIGYNSNDMETLKGALRGLAETVAEWDLLSENGEREWGVSSLLSYAKLKGGVCEYAYSPALAGKLSDPKVFALINLNIQRRFTSGHALALYENCYRFVRTGSTGWWELDLFRRLMGVEESAYYQIYKNLNAKIIKPAVAEVNKTSNILLTPETRKQGRAVVAIRFLIKENPQLGLLDIDDGEAARQGAVYGRLRAQGVSDRLARQWIAEHGEVYVAEKLAYVAGQGEVSSPARYLSAAIREDYRAGGAEPDAGGSKRRDPGADPAAAPQTQAAAAKLAARHLEDQARAAAEAAREEALSAERRRRAALLERIAQVAAARSPTQRDADRRSFLASLSDPLERDDFARHGWGSALSLRAMQAFWEELAPGVFEDLTGEGTEV